MKKIYMSRKHPTKYHITEKVYILEDNKVKESEITGIYVTKDEKGRKETHYITTHYQTPPVEDKNWIVESRIFKTKKSLLNSL